MAFTQLPYWRLYWMMTPSSWIDEMWGTTLPLTGSWVNWSSSVAVMHMVAHLLMSMLSWLALLLMAHGVLEHGTGGHEGWLVGCDFHWQPSIVLTMYIKKTCILYTCQRKLKPTSRALHGHRVASHFVFATSSWLCKFTPPPPDCTFGYPGYRLWSWWWRRYFKLIVTE